MLIGEPPMRVRWWLLFAISLSGGPLLADPFAKLPDYVQLPAGADVKDSIVWRYDSFAIDGADGKPEDRAGKRWHVHLFVDDLQKGTDQAGAVKKLQAAFAATAWTIVHDSDRQPSFHRQQDRAESWMQLSLGGGEANIDIIEAAPLPIALKLIAPGERPEPIDPAAGDFPYLSPLSPGTLWRSEPDPHPVMVQLPGADKAEAIGSSSIIKIYSHQEHISNYEFLTVYVDALTKAGWKIVSTTLRGDCSITAHYASHDRNLWAFLHSAPLGEFSFQVADVGDLASPLGKECHVALYGVFFDFDKSTLKPESEPALQKVAALLINTSRLQVEVQGHTDSIGNDEHNQALSEARARAVVDWLRVHRVPAGKLTAKGYGKSRPVADNATDEGRAKNRRVEIADSSCKPTSK